MNKKFLSAVLFGALMVTSTGTFVSCKDYDDDIDQINKELTDIKSAISELQTKVGAGKFVTNIAKEGDGIKITWNDNTTNTIETIKGDKGDKTLVTIVDGYWAFDGVKSDYPAKGDKGEDGAAAAAGHDAKISEDGYWMVWDATQNNGTGAYVKTEYIAGGATAVAGKNGWTIIVRDKDGKEQSIYVPNSADLVSIAPALGESTCDFTIYYGLLTSEVEWTGAKGKMAKGMYPTLDRDVQMMLNPTGVDGTAYKFEFKGSDDKALWGLTLKDAEPYDGEKMTRAASASGVWTLPRDIEYVKTEELNERADYVTQFKKNDGQYYAFALSATSVDDPSKVIKSQYIYTLKPLNVGNIQADKFSYVNTDKYNYVWNKDHKPNFDAYTYQQGATEWLGLSLSQVIYDYKLEIDKTRMTDVTINKYGLQISEDGYTFNATKEAAVDNVVYLKLSYILVNGSQTTTTFSVRIVSKDIVDVNSNIGSINEKFNASLVSAAKAPFTALANKYVFSKSISFDLAEKLGSNYDEWVDAMYNGLRGNSNDGKANFLKNASIMTGGDPINNSAAYNEALMDNFIYFDYVDADGKSCVYDIADDKLIASVKNIKALKVYFIAGTALYQNGWTIANTTPVKAPYYTVSGRQSNAWNINDGYALPLDNAFRVQLAVAKEEQSVAGFDFTFQLTMPDNCPIKRKSVGNQTTAWSANEDGVDVLKVYGEKLDREAMAADLRDAFVGVYNFQNGAYNDDANIEGQWYELTVPTNHYMIIGKSNEDIVTLAQISPSSVYTQWNTRGFYVNGHLDEYTLTNVKYHHFNVYTEKQGDIILKFASKVADSQKAQVKSAGTTANPFVAKAVYNADKTLNHYEFSVSNGNFTMTDAFDNAYSLFDEANKLRANLHVKLLEDRQGIVIDKNAPSYYGLYPSAMVDGVATNLVTYALDKAGDADKTVKMVMSIDKTAGVDKVFEITYNVTDVFGCVKPVKFYVRTVNDAIGNDDEE
ncbi:PL29 family lyase N-terminal domain-containing protein [Phocaeicola sp.]